VIARSTEHAKNRPADTGRSPIRMTEPSTKAFADSSAPVRKGEELDAARLGAYLAEQLHEPHARLEIEQFPQGFSNLTYLVRFGSEDYVLRRPPFGNTVKSAHDMGREYNVLSKLSKVYELAPKPIVYCTDEAVLGAPFYLMERRRGVILRRKLPKDLKLDPATFRGLGTAFIDNLARLHALDFRAAGLADLGKPEGYVERQVNGWIGRYEKAKTDEWPEMDSVAKWLVENRPPESGAALIHNDYKFDNVVLDSHDLTKIIGVLDWEMCTIGDPLMDLGCTLAYWIQADDTEALKYFVPGPTFLPGNLTRRELLERYAQTSDRDVRQVLFYYCYGLYKLAVIIQQIYARFARGFTQDPRFADMNQQVGSLSRSAARAIAIGGVS
jgi:aminoglycoside phosphotransferase (APT) family kinase protein